MPVRLRHEAAPAIRLLLLPLILSSLAAGCEVQVDSAKAAAEHSAAASGVREREAPRVRVAPLEEREMVQRLETTSVIESEAEIELLPRASGIAVAVLAEEGDHVEEGEVLARLDDRDAKLAVRDAEVALEEARNRADTVGLAIEEARAGIESKRLEKEQAKRDFERNDRLHGGDSELPSALSAQAVEASRLALERASHDLVMAELTLERSQVDSRDAEIAVSRAEVALERARLAHEYTSILAPISGVIASRSIRVGDTVGTQSVFVLTDTQNLRAVFFRPQRELGLFTARSSRLDGDGSPLEVTARSEALPGLLFRGYIVRTSPTIDAQSGSFRVTARLSITPEDAPDLDTERLHLLPGMLVRLEIVTDRHPHALVVQKRAVRREGEESFVLVVEDRLAHRVLVQEGFAEDDFVEVLPLEPGSLTVGDTIVTVGSRDLRDGQEVRIESPQAEAAGEVVAATGDEPGSADTEGKVDASGAGTDDDGEATSGDADAAGE